MSRDANGNYTLPAGNPVISGTTIDTGWANPTMSDLGTEITNSLSRTGKGGMLAPFRVPDGGVSSPSLSFTQEPTSGLYRFTGSDVRMTVGGVDRMRWTAAGASVWDDEYSLWILVSSGSNIPITSAVDLNDIPTSYDGRYSWDIDAPVNAPTSTLSTLTVTPVNVDNGIQIVTEIATGATFKRIKAGGVWAAWIGEENIPIDGYYFTASAALPNTTLGYGTWELLAANTTIEFGDGTVQDTVPVGDNTPAVPLLSHTHGMTHAHTMNHDHPNTGSSSAGAHTHSTTIDAWGSGGSGTKVNKTTSADGQTNFAFASNSAGAHTHTVDIPNYVGNTGNSPTNTGSAGEATPTLDVRGSRVTINVYKRLT